MEANIQGSKTEANLISSWKAKSVSKIKYQFYEFKAGRDKERYNWIAKYLEEVAKNDSMHSKSFYMTLWGPVPKTEINIETLLKQEHEDGTHIIPEYAKIAREEGFEEIAFLLEEMAKADRAQEKKYADILEKMKNNRLFEKDTKQDWRCGQCGYIHNDFAAPEKCPVCEGLRRTFELDGANFSIF